MNVLFMGTSEFAVPCLEKLLQKPEINLCAVVTVPDKPAGRSLRVSESPVKVAARNRNIPILQPVDLRDPFFLRSIQGYSPDIAAVVAFRILPVELFTIPKNGCINLHASLLPDLRGAAPIQWALIRGYERTGVTTFLIERRVDTGGLLKQAAIRIAPDDDAGTLGVKLAEIGANLLVESILRVSTDELQAVTQSGKPTMAPKITKELCQIDWNKPAVEIRNLIRGLSPAPAAYTVLEGKIMKIFRSSVLSDTYLSVGEARAEKNNSLTIGTGYGSLLIEELQVEGRRRMKTSEFLRGTIIPAGTILG